MDEYPSYWMWARRDLSGRTHMKPNQYDDSWEEQAFAEDSSLALGGSVWPPRSYSCSFCRREFKSAQALGGHMNVHRRDRARLKQCSSIDQPEDQSHVVGEYPSRICTLVYKDELNIVSTGRVTNPFVQEKSCNDYYSKDKSLVSPAYSFCTIGQELAHKQPFFSFISTEYSHRDLASNESKFGVEEDKLVVRSNLQETDHVMCKRRRIDLSLSSSSLFDTSLITSDDQRTIGKDASSLFCFQEPKTNVRHDHSLQSELFTGAHSTSEHLDLELRLGAVRPKFT